MVIKVTFGDLRAEKNKRDYFPMRRVISHRVRLSLIVQIPCIVLSLKGNIIWTQSQTIWTCSIGPVMSLSVAFISVAKKVARDFCQTFSQLLRVLFSLNL